jgi:hypothetical protein
MAVTSTLEAKILVSGIECAPGVPDYGQGPGLQHAAVLLPHIVTVEGRYFMGDNAKLAPAGFGVAPTPWGAVQQAAWAAVGR